MKEYGRAKSFEKFLSSFILVHNDLMFVKNKHFSVSIIVMFLFHRILTILGTYLKEAGQDVFQENDKVESFALFNVRHSV